MSLLLPACKLIDDRRQELKLSEKKSTYRGINSKKRAIQVYQVGNCLKQDGRMCNFLVIAAETLGAYFIELKGSHYAHACTQIEATCAYLIKELKDFHFLGRIVSSRMPSPRLKTDQQKRLEQFLLRHNNSVKKTFEFKRDAFLAATKELQEEL